LLKNAFFQKIAKIAEYWGYHKLSQHAFQHFTLLLSFIKVTMSYGLNRESCIPSLFFWENLGKFRQIY